MEGAFKNMVDWIHNNLHTDLIKYVTNSQMHTTNNVIQAKILYQTYKLVLHTYSQGWNYQQTITKMDT